MSMQLGYLRRHLREQLKETNPDDSLWTDLTLNDFLNEGAKVFASRTQPIDTLFQFQCSLVPGTTTNEFRREYKLPADMDEIFSVFLYNGEQYELRKCDMAYALRNSNFVGIPDRFYVRALTRKRIESNSQAITPSELDTSNKKARRMIGLHPKPSTNYVVTVCYYASHFWMRNDADSCIIPFEFCRGVIDYAAYLAHSSDEMYATANLYLEKFNSAVEGCRAKMINQGQETRFPTVRLRDDDEERNDDYYEVGFAY